MKIKVLFILILLLTMCAGCNTVSEPTYSPVLSENDVVEFAFSNVISEYGDIELGADGYYHFPMDKVSGQVPRHIFGEILVNDTSFTNSIDALHGATVEWQSNLEWVLTDSATYIIRRRCPYNDDDTWCVMNMEQWIPSDTVVIDYFDGMIVPTINASSYPNGSEVGTVIAPLVAMVGDTMIVNVRADFEGRVIAAEIRIILE